MGFLRSNKPAFTLIELLVAISIMGLLSSIVVANYRENEEVRKLKTQSELIVDGIEKTQNMALTGLMIENRIPLGFKFKVDSCDNDCKYEIRALFYDSEDDSQEELNPIIDSRQFSNLIISNYLEVDFLLPRGKIRFVSNDNNFNVTGLNNSGCFNISLDSLSGRIVLEKCNK